MLPPEARAWAAELDAARGPKPLGAIERLFVSCYVPLASAVAAGAEDPAARASLAAWSANFARSWKDAFGALRVTGKRPVMVLDAPAIAARVGRLHGARSTCLLLVDGMRFDVGLRVHERLRTALGRRAVCTERFLLWAALPTTSAAQIELIGRGPEGLAQPPGSADAPEPAPRGRSANVIRRLRAGHRDLLKLDVVGARLAEAGGPEPGRLDAVADEAAAAIGQLVTTLASGTMLLIFGDHGFRLDPSGGGTGPARQGGASPEEVLVPAFAWLVGGIQ